MAKAAMKGLKTFMVCVRGFGLRQSAQLRFGLHRKPQTGALESAALVSAFQAFLPVPLHPL